MGKLGCFSVKGLDLWFNSNDHEPPHFHARKTGCWEVRISILERQYTVKWARTRVQKATLRSIFNLVEVYRAELLKEWEQKVDC